MRYTYQALILLSIVLFLSCSSNKDYYVYREFQLMKSKSNKWIACLDSSQNKGIDEIKNSFFVYNDCNEAKLFNDVLFFINYFELQGLDKNIETIDSLLEQRFILNKGFYCRPSSDTINVRMLLELEKQLFSGLSLIDEKISSK